MSSFFYFIEVFLFRVEDFFEVKICLVSFFCVISISCEVFRVAAGRVNCGLLFCFFIALVIFKW